MRRSLLDILACPVCKSDLELEVQKEEISNGESEIVEGKLICRKCQVSYPIEDGIPNLLPPGL